MKRFTFQLISLVLTAFFITNCANSCDEVEFSEPQPEFKSKVNTFEKKYLGQYVNVDESSFITINKTSITQKYIAHFSEALVKLKSDPSILFNGNEIKIDGTFYRYFMRGDSVFINMEIKDTLFSLSETTVLKEFKNSLFVNKKTACNGWITFRIFFNEKGLLTISSFEISKDNIENVREVVDRQDSSTQYLLKPTRKEFKKNLLSLELKNQQQYIKLKE